MAKAGQMSGLQDRRRRRGQGNPVLRDLRPAVEDREGSAGDPGLRQARHRLLDRAAGDPGRQGLGADGLNAAAQEADAALGSRVSLARAASSGARRVSTPGAASRRAGRAPGRGARRRPYLLLAAGAGHVRASSPSTRSSASSTSASSTGTSSPAPPTRSSGSSNYTAIFHDPIVRTAALNSFLFIVITVPVQMAIGLFAAAHAHRPPSRLAACGAPLVYIPVVTSWVVVSWVFAYIFSSQGGVANAVVGLLRRPYGAASTGPPRPGRPTRVIWLLEHLEGRRVVVHHLPGRPRRRSAPALRGGAASTAPPRPGSGATSCSLRSGPPSTFVLGPARHRRRPGLHPDLPDHQGRPIQLDPVPHDLHVPAGVHQLRLRLRRRARLAARRRRSSASASPRSSVLRRIESLRST